MGRRYHAGFVALASLACAGDAVVPGGGSRAAAREGLLEADRAFYEATAERGAEGWAAFFTEDARQFVEGGSVLQGRRAIRDLMAGVFARPGSALWWEPTFADVSASGDLGYTTGTYRGTTITDDGDTVTAEGRYVTIWQKQSDGSWKVVLDIGNALDEPAAGR